MKLVVVEASFGNKNRTAAVPVLQEHADGVRAMDGCVSYTIYESGASLAIIQRWQTMDHFDSYRQSDLFAKLGAALKPLMTSPPVTTTAMVDHH